MPKIIIVRPGDRFNRWTVIRELAPLRVPGGTIRQFECRCDCGSIGVQPPFNLRNGLSKSCGCWRSENSRIIATTHGDCGSPEHTVWRKMLERCFNPKDKSFPDYGGRGIVVCDEWRHDYAAFLAHVGRRPGPLYSIDRIDNARGYEPGNVKWSVRKDQNRNKRNTIMVTVDGVQRRFVEMCEETGVPYCTAKARRKRGWPDSRLFIP